MTITLSKACREAIVMAVAEASSENDLARYDQVALSMCRAIAAMEAALGAAKSAGYGLIVTNTWDDAIRQCKESMDLKGVIDEDAGRDAMYQVHDHSGRTVQIPATGPIMRDGTPADPEKFGVIVID